MYVSKAIQKKGSENAEFS